MLYIDICLHDKSLSLANQTTIELLIAQVSRLTKRVELLEQENTLIRKDNLDLRKRNTALENENLFLKTKIGRYENPKTSRNSSIPPSKDENRPPRTRSLREKTGRKPGGQKGRKGNTLKMVAIPDFIDEHIPDFCSCCGEVLSSIPCEFVGKRQVMDLPEIKIQVTEHRILKRVCVCGHKNTAAYPIEANAPVSYGNNIQSLIGYLHTRQYIPFKRMEEFVKDVFNIPISEGGIHYLLNKLVDKAKPAYELIREKIKSTKELAVGTDETGVKVGGDKYWAWTWQNEEATFISITDNRAGKSITANFETGFENAVLVHDCWKSHFNTEALSHQVCIAHLLRELNYFTERYNHKWSKVCKELLLIAIHLKSKMIKTDYYIQNYQRATIEKRMSILLNYQISTDKKELITFQKRLVKYQDYLFTFLYHPKVPPDNNASERAIRNIKVKQKVSGQFRTPEGAFGFAVLRSLTDTILKNKQNVLSSLKVIANLHTD